MGRWSTRLLIVIAALASIATSPKSWQLVAQAPAGMPTASPGGSKGLLVTIEASTRPEVKCDQREEVWPEPAAAQDTTRFEVLCMPGETLREVQLHGRGTQSGFCGDGNPKPPKTAFLRVTKTELVDTWHAATEASFEVGSDVTKIRVDSPRFARVELLDGATARGVVLHHMGGNYYSLSHTKSETVKVRAHVIGPCRPDCAQPAGEKLAIVKRDD